MLFGTSAKIGLLPPFNQLPQAVTYFLIRPFIHPESSNAYFISGSMIGQDVLLS